MRILIVAKTFPPTVSAQALQAEKVSRAIAGTGCEVIVVAGIDLRNYVNPPDKPCFIYLAKYVPYVSSRSGLNSKMGKLWRYMSNEIASMNPISSWVSEATAEANNLIDKFHPDALLTLSTPFESHFVGLNLKKRGIPWVASFSDPWPSILNPAPYNSRAVPLISSWQLSLAREVLNRCDALHMHSRYGLELVQRRMEIHLENKGWTIPHIGSCIQSRTNIPAPPNGWLAHVGDLNRERSSRPLIKAVKECALNKSFNFLGLMCVGYTCPEFRKLIYELGAENIVNIKNPYPPVEAQKLCSESEALLVIEADMEVSPFLPSKFADYACAGRPIVAITPPNSAIRDYLNEYGGGYAITNSEKEIADAICKTFLCGLERPEVGRKSENNNLASVFEEEVVGEKYRVMFVELLS